MMINLLQETIDDLVENGKKVNEVLWVGAVNFGYVSFDEFAEVAKDFNYDNGYGAAEVPRDLVVVGKDFWLERYEYDGAESWDFKTMPVRPESPLTKLTLGYPNENRWISLKNVVK